MQVVQFKMTARAPKGTVRLKIDVSEFHGGKEFQPVPTQWKNVAAERSSVKTSHVAILLVWFQPKARKTQPSLSQNSKVNTKFFGQVTH